jgi:predicted PhzF superfamily epimerase YddE/YHI9
MNASVGQWLTGRDASLRGYRISQGTRLGRAGDVTVVVEDGAVWVGGAITSCFRGTATI